MKIVSAAEMREVDRATSERFGIPSLTLMENAGSAVARFILADYPHAERIGIICGKGNNGGDGFVVARKLVEAGRAVRVLVLCDAEEIRGDAAEMFQQMLGKLQPLNISPLIVTEQTGTSNNLDSPEAAEIFAADVIVDAILGTGFRPPVSPLYAAVIVRMNEAKMNQARMNRGSTPIVAVDIPSGADADASQPVDSGRSSRARADAIVTFTAPRPAHVFGALTDGCTVIAPIGSPSQSVVSQLGLNLSTAADFAELLAPRAHESNKGTYGHVLIIGGSLGKAGAAAMAGFAALKTGAGLSSVATPKSVLATVAAFHPELMTEPMPETDAGTISLKAIESTVKLVKQKTVAIGPGISRNSETASFVRSLVERDESEFVNMVIDADGLNAFEGFADKLKDRGRTLVITPHPGEMSRLTSLSIREIQADRLKVARDFAREHELIVVLKGHRTLIAAPDGTVWVNATGNPGMATGGTGDVLTGIIAGLLSQHPNQALIAVALAVYLHGLAGDLASQSLGENSLVATDLINYLPQAFARARTEKYEEVRFHA